jgi:DNA-binding NarL/FixJ family response regulator
MANLLVVEDNRALIGSMVRFLHKQGRHTVVAVVHTGEAALEQLPHLNIDLALVDVSLPRMSGIDLVGLIHEQYSELRCLMLSGHNELEYVRRALVAGAWGYVTKGNPRDLLEAIQTVLDGQTYLSEEFRDKFPLE